MIKRLSILLIAVMLIPAFISAQEQTYMRPDGKFYKSSKVPTSYEVMKMKHARVPNSNTNVMPSGPLAGVDGLLDTLKYPMESPGSNFGLNGQDILMQWFKAPADLTIKGFGYYATENLGGLLSEGKIVSVNLTEDQLMALPVKQYGYYQATGNGYNDITGYLDNADRTGDWVSITPGDPEPFGSDLWSDGGFGAPSTPDPTLEDYQWVNTNILFEPTVSQGDIFAISFNSTYNDMTVRSLGMFAGVTAGVPGWKYYANGRLVTGSAGDIGWWVREYTWDFVVAVDITGDTPPDFNTITAIPSGLDAGPFTIDANITDANPGNPANAGVASAKLIYSVDGGSTWTEVAMTGADPNFSGVIPAQAPGSTVEYYLEATDVAGQTSVSMTNSFYIFTPTPGVKTLVYWNGYANGTSYPQSYYFGADIRSGAELFAHDTWVYGPLSADLLNNYDNLIEICNGGPDDYNDDVVRAWLAGAGNRNYYLEGQEWLGARYSYTNKAFVAGDFEFDIFGINYVYNDISYANSTGQALPQLLTPVAGTEFGQPQLDIFATYTPVPDSIQYDPTYEGGVDNWMDAFTVESDVEVAVNVETRGIDNSPDVQTLPAAMSRVLPAGNKVFFASYWTLFVNTTETNYNWLGYEKESSAYHALLWFGIPIVLDVEQVGSGVPEVYNLSQNYPNPFNPSTTISFSLPKGSNVVLKIYDVLGREVATLLNGEKPAGNYEVNFDASKLSSGLYVYTINAGEFTSTKKMMLMK
jgi:hypothetical protein